MRITPVLCAVILGSLAACSEPDQTKWISSDDTNAPTIAAEPVTAPATATTAISLPPSTTSAPEPTAAPTTAAAFEPTTTVVDLNAQVRAGLVETFANRSACFADPPSCDTTTFASLGSEYQLRAAETVLKLINEGLYYRPSPETKVFIERVMLDDEGRTNVRLCYVDRSTQMHTLNTPDPVDDAVVREVTLSDARFTYVELVGSSWLFTKYDLVERFEGTGSCSNI